MSSWIEKLAEWTGLPGATMDGVIKGESVPRPGATGVDKEKEDGYGLWETTEAQDEN